MVCQSIPSVVIITRAYMIQCCSVVKGFNFNLIARKCLKPLFELSVTVSKQFFFPLTHNDTNLHLPVVH